MKDRFLKRHYQSLLIILLTTSCSDSLKLETKVPIEKVAHVTTGEVETIPSAPSKLVVLGISGSEGVNPFPTIRVEGVKSGYTVKIFSDSSCTQELGSAVASGTSVDVTVSSELSLGTYTFYSQSSNTLGSSPCSTENVEYTLISCPTKFILVPYNTDVGTNKDFCVMKYEARDNGSSVPASLETGSPWNNISASEALKKCTELGTGYDLISNPEWMTIARNVETVASNFEDEVMARGWAASKFEGDQWTNTATASSSEASCLYNTGANDCASTGSHKFRRTLSLSNGEEIWDFSGNLFEWVDWHPEEPLYQSFSSSSSICSPVGWREFPAALNNSCVTGGSLSKTAVFPSLSGADSSKGFGYFFYAGGNATMRGGAWGSGKFAGAYTILLGVSDDPIMTVGFRCVYRP